MSNGNLDELIKEATEIGLSRGWSHANYVDAYGGDPNEAPEVPGRFASVESYFISAYEEGVQNFQNDLNEDGTPRDDS